MTTSNKKTKNTKKMLYILFAIAVIMAYHVHSILKYNPEFLGMLTDGVVATSYDMEWINEDHGLAKYNPATTVKVSDLEQSRSVFSWVLDSLKCYYSDYYGTLVNYTAIDVFGENVVLVSNPGHMAMVRSLSRDKAADNYYDICIGGKRVAVNIIDVNLLVPRDTFFGAKGLLVSMMRSDFGHLFFGNQSVSELHAIVLPQRVSYEEHVRKFANSFVDARWPMAPKFISYMGVFAMLIISCLVGGALGLGLLVLVGLMQSVFKFR